MITTFSENALIPEQENTKEELALIKRRLMAVCEELDYTLSSLSEDNFSLDLRNRLASIEKSCEASDKEQSQKNSYAYTTPTGSTTGGWSFDFGGYIKIGNIVIVKARMHPTSDFTFSGAIELKGGFPRPQGADGSSFGYTSLAAVTNAPGGVIINASIKSDGTLQLRGRVSDSISSSNSVDFSGIYLTNS